MYTVQFLLPALQAGITLAPVVGAEGFTDLTYLQYNTVWGAEQ